MTDWSIVAARLALYADLGLLFGIGLFPAPMAMWRGFRLTGWSAVLAGAGLLLSLIAFGLQMAAMLGGAPQDNPAIIWEVVRSTAFGWALVARLIALGLALLLALSLPASTMKRRLLSGCGAVALVSLAWSGHAAAGEGVIGWAHLMADGLHLLAAGAWIGALAMLLALVTPRAPVDRDRVDAACQALTRFSRTGSFIVAILVLTGLLNAGFLVEPAKWPHLARGLYGQLLLAKLALFLAMLGCAALNRFRLTPRLARSGSARQALGHLRASIAIETLLALLVLALVAWLGTLSPSEIL